MKKFSWWQPSLARGIGIRMGLLALASILALTMLTVQREREYSRKELERQAEIVLETTALSMRDELYGLKRDEFQDLANKVDENAEITLFVAYDRQGRILVDSSAEQMTFSQNVDPLGGKLIALAPDKTYYEWQADQLVAGQAVWIQNDVIGAIAVGLSTEVFNQKIADLTRQGLTVALAVILIGATLTLVMARRITMPLSELAHVANNMKDGSLHVRAHAGNAYDEIRTLSQTFNRMADAIQERERALREQAEGLERTVNERTADLQEQARILEEMAITDPLTRAYNRRQFYKLAEIEIKRAAETGLPLSVIVMDADHFKRINDNYGHQAGDQALIALTEICQQLIRCTDIFARYGGEEFVILMPNADMRDAKQIAERIRQKIEAHEINAENKKIRFTISLGVSTFTSEQQLAFDSLLTQADRALYVSKKAGRNRITHWAEQKMQHEKK